MSASAIASTIQQEPELLGQTVVVIGRRGGIGFEIAPGASQLYCRRLREHAFVRGERYVPLIDSPLFIWLNYTRPCSNRVPELRNSLD